jgi:hypothetical protein
MCSGQRQSAAYTRHHHSRPSHIRVKSQMLLSAMNIAVQKIFKICQNQSKSRRFLFLFNAFSLKRSKDKNMRVMQPGVIRELRNLSEWAIFRLRCSETHRSHMGLKILDLLNG